MLTPLNHDITPEDFFLDRDDNTAVYVNARYSNRYILGLAVVIVSLLSLFLLRAFQLQILQSSEDEVVNQGLIAETYIKPLRGNIYDRNGVLLAYNKVLFSLILDKQTLPQDKLSQESILTEVKAFFKLEDQLVAEALANSESKVELTNNISAEQAVLFQVNENKYPGLILTENIQREYIDGQYFAHLIGYTGKLSAVDIQQNPRYLRDGSIGKTGIEKFYETTLKGEYGLRNMRNPAQLLQAPQNGKSIQLTLDSQLQKVLQDSIQEVLISRKLTKAAGIVMNPQTGEILAMVSLPSFDNNIFTKGISQAEYGTLLDNSDNPLLNRCIAGEYAPASTIKPIVASALLQEGIVNTTTSINDPNGRLVVENPFDKNRPFVYPDWKIHGKSDIYKSISDSVNVFYYTFAGGTPNQKGLGIEALARYYRLYGFGSLTGIDIPGERAGNVADPNWKQQLKNEAWLLGDTYNVSIGQGGMTATPLQILQAINAIANGGKLYQPHLYRGIYSDGLLKDEFEPKSQSLPIDSAFMAVVQEGMRRTVSQGTGYLLQSLAFSTAAKTGTAQTGKEANNSWFVSYAPAENPQISTIVLVEEGNEGFETTVPITKKIYEWYYQNRQFK